MLKNTNTLKDGQKKPFIENKEIGGNGHDYSLTVEKMGTNKMV